MLFRSNAAVRWPDLEEFAAGDWREAKKQPGEEAIGLAAVANGPGVHAVIA